MHGFQDGPNSGASRSVDSLWREVGLPRRHSNLEGQHAFLGASKYHWINYTDDKIADSYVRFLATQKGTVLHAFAAQCILLGQKLPKSQKTLNMYVNDAIGYKMTPEQILYYSPNCFGTTDAICFRNNFLRIHDLKTGEIDAHIEQLEVYAALFCLKWNCVSTSTTKFCTISRLLRIFCQSWTGSSQPIRSSTKLEKRMVKLWTS